MLAFFYCPDKTGTERQHEVSFQYENYFFRRGA